MVWKISDLKVALQKESSIVHWMILQDHIERAERYFLQGDGALEIDSERKVEVNEVQIRFLTQATAQADGTLRQGEMTVKLSKAQELKPQIEQALLLAQKSSHAPWAPGTPSKVSKTKVQSFDPQVRNGLKSILESVSEKIAIESKEHAPCQFHSAECFVSYLERKVELSSGWTHTFEQSRIYTEAAFSYTQNERSDEAMETLTVVGLEHLDLKELYSQIAQGALHSLTVQKPVAGIYPVILDSTVMMTLLNGYLDQLSSSSEYLKLPHRPIGSEFIEGSQSPMTLQLDPTVPLMGATTLVNEWGLEQVPLTLVDQGKVTAMMTDFKYGNYLKRPAVTTLGNLKVSFDSKWVKTYEQLTQMYPKVLEILSFSGLFFDPMNGTFSSEIRLAKLYEQNGKVTYLKGGSLSGNIQEHFKTVYCSDQSVQKTHFDEGFWGQSYLGPSHVLLTGVSIAS